MIGKWAGEEGSSNRGCPSAFRQRSAAPAPPHRPLAVTKNGTGVIPHQNWRGQFSSGTYTNGSLSDCPAGVNTGCTSIAWPGWRTTAWHAEAEEPHIRNWYGGLVDGMRDASGQMYMRNRYYDPQTGQFTQPDPTWTSEE